MIAWEVLGDGGRMEFKISERVLPIARIAEFSTREITGLVIQKMRRGGQLSGSAIIF
jgi:hypothetical protein